MESVEIAHDVGWSMPEIREGDAKHRARASTATAAMHRNAFAREYRVARDAPGPLDTRSFCCWVTRPHGFAIQILQRNGMGLHLAAVVGRDIVMGETHHMANADIPHQLPINACRKPHADQRCRLSGDEI